MTTRDIPMLLEIDSEAVTSSLQQASEKLSSADGEVVLDFSSVLRINPGALQALEKLAAAAKEKAIKVVLRGINVEMYKVLKLARLTAQFSFLA